MSNTTPRPPKREVRKRVLELLKADVEKTGLAHGGKALKDAYRKQYGTELLRDTGNANILSGMVFYLRKKNKLPAPPRGRPRVQSKQSSSGPKVKSTRLTRKTIRDVNHGGLSALPHDHPAIAERRTKYPTTVITPFSDPQVFKPGEYNLKIGRRVEKGRWAGFPILSLTLEERATCPASCHHFDTCMGNDMPFAKRYRGGKMLENRLDRELKILDERFPNGFVIRLHILGDFYSVEYVNLWESWLHKYPGLHVFGYTAWPDSTAIGDALRKLRDKRWKRFAIRFSRPRPKEDGREAVTVPDEETGKNLGLIMCPQSDEKTLTCGTCALCWDSNKNIGFLFHGRGNPDN